MVLLSTCAACLSSPRLWEALCLELVPELCALLIGDVTHHEEAVRSAGAEALSKAVSEYRGQSPTVLARLTELYHQKLYVRPGGSLCWMLLSYIGGGADCVRCGTWRLLLL